KNSVIQNHFYMTVDIPESNFQSLSLFFSLIHGRQSLQSIFSLFDLMAHIFQIGHLASVRINDTETIVPVVSGSISRVLQKLGIQRKASVVNALRISGKASVYGSP